jgi:hypothetical protein
MKYFSIIWPTDCEGGIARKPDGWSLPPFSQALLAQNWRIPSFALDGPFVDLQPNDAGLKLLSKRLRDTLDGHRSQLDRIEWLAARIANRMGDSRDYYIPHFLDASDVLCLSKSVINGATGSIIKPHLCSRKVADRRVFTYLPASGLVVIVSAAISNALQSYTDLYLAHVGVSDCI